MAEYSKRTRKQEALIAALLSEPNQEAAAAKAGVGERTLYRWLKLPEFQDAYREARRKVLEEAVAKMQAGSSQAADTILAVTKTGEKAADRVRAAKLVMDFAFKGLLEAAALHGEPPAATGAVNTVDGMLTRAEEEARRQMLVRDPEYAELASAMLQRELDLSKEAKPNGEHGAG